MIARHRIRFSAYHHELRFFCFVEAGAGASVRAESVCWARSTGQSTWTEPAGQGHCRRYRLLQIAFGIGGIVDGRGMFIS
jgi:hypothetical protein